jgi:ribonuclease R
MVHRILGEILDHHKPRWDEDQLRAIADESSITERRADEAERELVEWKKAKFMADLVGQEFDGLIISTTRFGFFVELDKYFVEGLVPIESLPGDRYLYNENARKIVGDRSRREYSMGDQVRVILDRVDTTERKLTFSVLEERPLRKRRKG